MKLNRKTLRKMILSEVKRVITESDRFYGIIPIELWEISDYEDLQYAGLDLNLYPDEILHMKIEQLDEEIEYELANMQDPQNQYDMAVAPKESLKTYIEGILRNRRKTAFGKDPFGKPIR